MGPFRVWVFKVVSGLGAEGFKIGGSGILRSVVFRSEFSRLAHRKRCFL